MLTIVCGGDGVGKSTLCEGIREKTDTTWETTHFCQPKDMNDGKRQYFEFLNKVKPGHNYLCDRFHDGEHVYAPLYRGYESTYLAEIEDRMVNLDANYPLMLYVTADVAEVERRVKLRGEDYVKAGDHKVVRSNYEQFMDKQMLPFAIIDTTEGNRADALNDAKAAMAKCRTIFDQFYDAPCHCRLTENHICVPRGNINAKYFVVGQNPARSKSTLMNTRMWTYARSSMTLIDALKANDVYLDCWFANVVACETPDNKVGTSDVVACRSRLVSQVNTVDPQVIIALGDEAYTAVVNAGLDAKYVVRKVIHPAAARRFGKTEQFNEQLKDVLL